jgi:putative tricarboxylic transport membrane protein
VSQRRDVVASVVFLALGVGVCIQAARLGFGSVLMPEPGFFPWIGGVTLVVLSTCLFVRSLGSRAAAAAADGDWTPPALLLAVLVVYVPLLEPLGYPVATTGLCVVALRILKTRRWSVTLGVSAALAVGTFYLFNRMLGVELPVGALFGG